MSKKGSILVLIIAIAALCLGAVSLALALGRPASAPAPAAEAAPKDIQYVLYLGTNDKDTVEPVFPPEEAKERLEEILIRRFGGYTVQDASGGWVDGGKEYQEYTLVIYLSDTTLEDVHALCDELVEVYRQSSVLIQANETTTEFYSGRQ